MRNQFIAKNANSCKHSANTAGFARIDSAAGKLLMECDAERFQIPFSSIISATAERFMMPIDQHTEFWYSRVVVKIPNGSREILFCDATPVWGRRTNAMRKQRAEEISGLLNESL